ncbi:MAG TPA: protoporphyrinogen oxidase, partial [Kineosporiaceae bacterium]|nr:protoporphyrinogen oxidase [Kineosporiaceae bacterium]
MRTGRRVVVVGGGISGLAAAYFLTHRARHTAGDGDDHAPQADGDAAGPHLLADRPQVLLLEAGHRLGGKIRTAGLAGHPVDTGPDAILARAAVVENLLRDLGLVGSLSHPGSRRAYVWTRGELRPLPPTSLFGVPDTPLPLLRSRVLSPWGALRAGADFVLPRQALPPDPTIAQLLRPRFGREVFDQLVEPMLGGVHAGRADVLSARSAVPEVYLAARGSRSTYLALRRREAPTGRGLGMVTLSGGLTQLVTTLRDRLEASGVQVRTGSGVTSIERTGTGYRLQVGGQSGEVESVEADAVVLATPAPVTGSLLQPLVPAATAALAGIPYVGVATVSLAYPLEAVGRPLDGTGFLVPPKEGRFLVGVTWSSAKWPHLADDRVALFRCSVGRHGDQRWTDLPDEDLVDLVHRELVESMGMSGLPVAHQIKRWPGAMPQYTVGHEHRLVAVAHELGSLPGLHLTGAAYRGVGIASCISQAADVADALTAWLGGATPAPSGHPSDALGVHR